MSNNSNTNLLERAHEAAENLVSHPGGLDRQILAAIKDNDLEEVQRLTYLAEGLMAQEEIAANGTY